MTGSFCLANRKKFPGSRFVMRPRRARAKAAALDLVATVPVPVPGAPAFPVWLLRGRLAVGPVRPNIVLMARGFAILLQAGGAETAQPMLVDQALPAEEFVN